jgi:hypothetical protein
MSQSIRAVALAASLLAMTLGGCQQANNGANATAASANQSTAEANTPIASNAPGGPVAEETACKPTVEPTDLKDVVVKGDGCSEKEAKAQAILNASGKCTGKSDPKCPAAKECTNTTCQTTAMEATPTVKWDAATSVADDNCKGGKRYSIRGEAKFLHCRCACR